MIKRAVFGRWVQAAIIALAISGEPQSQAVTLFSVDATNDQLMLFDSVTGTVTVIGPLGDDALDIDLSLTGDGRLWGLNTDLGTRVDLWEINKTSGAIISAVQVFDGAGALTAAEGLGAQGNQLKIGYDPTGGFNSSTVANLSTAGVVGLGVSTIVDTDGLSGGNGNPMELYGVDRTPGVNTVIFGINPATGVETNIGTYSEARGFNDLVTLPGEAVLIDNFSDELYRIDIVTGSIQGSPTMLLVEGNYIGLARADQIPSSVEVPGNGSVPGAYQLHANVPNPFNPSTAIRFDLPTAGPVELSIFDVMGHRIARLVHENRPAGQYEELWTGRDEGGRTVSSGVYVYRLKAGEYVETKRMTLVK